PRRRRIHGIEPKAYPPTMRIVTSRRRGRRSTTKVALVANGSLTAFLRDVLTKYGVRVSTDDACWLSPANHPTWVRLAIGGKTLSAARFVYRLSRGVEPKGRVWRVCRRPFCLNPNHLSDGQPRRVVPYATLRYRVRDLRGRGA